MGKIRIKQIDLSSPVGADQRVRPKDQRVRPKETPVQTGLKPVSTPKSPKTPKPHRRSRKYKLALIDIEKNKAYPPEAAIGLVKKASYSRFNGSVELHLNLLDINIPQTLVLPHPIKKTIKILVFTDDDKLANQLVGKYGDTITAGGADLIEKIKKSVVSINKYHYALATPSIVSKLPSIARLLGPKGLMPNPKNKTITNNPAQKIDELLKGSLNLKPEPKQPLLHLVIGKVNDEEKNLLENLRTILKTIGVVKIKKAVLAPTMGPGIKLKVKS